MKFLKVRWLAAGVLAGGLMLTGCSASNSTVRVSPYTDNTGMGFGYISKTKQSDYNLWMPLEDPLRTRQQENIFAAAAEPTVEPTPTGIGGSGQCPPPEPPRSAQ